MEPNDCQAIGLLVAEQDFVCPCGCGARAKGFFRPKGWVCVVVYADEPSCVRSGGIFATFECMKRFFASWEPEKGGK